MKAVRHIIAFIAIAAMTATLSSAQGLRFENVRDRNLWLLGGNVSGMRADSLNLSYAELDGGYTWGENRQSWDAPKTWHVGAKAATIMHLKKFSMAGTFAFDQTMGYDACGSMFIQPFRYPVDVVEFTPGSKARQTYSFSGDLSVDLGEEWRIGAAVDFKAVNYSKRKDLRYTDFALDLDLRPGFQWHRGKLAIGLNAAVQRNAETIKAEQIGTSVEENYAFLNKSQWYGVYQFWEGSGVHLAESGINGFPVMEFSYGGAFQISYGGLYFEGSYLRHDGKIGEKDAIWFRYPVDEARGTLAWQGVSNKGTVHTVRIDGTYKHTDLEESVIDQRTSGGVITRQTFGWNAISSQNDFSVTPSWNAVRASCFEFLVKANYSLQQGLASIQYPYLNEQELQSIGAFGEARGIFSGWMPIVRVWGGSGWLSENTRFSSGAKPDMEQYRQLALYELWKQYETSAHIGCGVGLRYIFRKGFYLEADGDAEFRMQKNRITCALRFGYTF